MAGNPSEIRVDQAPQVYFIQRNPALLYRFGITFLPTLSDLAIMTRSIMKAQEFAALAFGLHSVFCIDLSTIPNPPSDHTILQGRQLQVPHMHTTSPLLVKIPCLGEREPR